MMWLALEAGSRCTDLDLAFLRAWAWMLADVC